MENWKVNKRQPEPDVTEVADESGIVLIASVYGADNEKRLQRARLIAAAPDLLEASQYTLGHLLDNPKYQKDDALFSCVSHLVNAIRKATEGK